MSHIRSLCRTSTFLGLRAAAMRTRAYQPRAWNSTIAPQSTSPQSSTPPPPPPSSKSSEFPPPPPRRSLPRHALRLTLLALTCTTLGICIATFPEYRTIQHLRHPPSDSETLSLFHPNPGTSEADIDAHILSHPLVRRLLADPRFRASRPHLKLPAAMRHNNLVGGALLGAGRISVPPLSFGTADGSSFVSVQHLGPGLCGHPGVVHGGLLATLLDEGLARCCFPALPKRVGVTASLKVDYKAPAPAGAYVVLRAETVKVEGRKAWVKGRVETLVDEEAGEVPTVLCEAEALFVEPRQAAAMMNLYGPVVSTQKDDNPVQK